MSRPECAESVTTRNAWYSPTIQPTSACQTNICSLVSVRVQLALDALDRLVDTLEERDPVGCRGCPFPLCDTLHLGRPRLFPACGADRGRQPGVCAGADDLPRRRASRSVARRRGIRRLRPGDPGLSAARDRICEIGAVRVRALELADSFQSLVNPGVALPEPIAASPACAVRSCGVRGRARPSSGASSARGRRPPRRTQRPVRPALDGAAAAPGARSTPVRAAASTAALAQRLLEGRLRRVGLASLAHFFGVSSRPCHRALPDAEATAEVLVSLIGLAQELGARRLSELRALAAPRERRVYDKRSSRERSPHPARRLPLSRPPRPGLCVGRARTCAPVCGRTSEASASGRRWRPPCRAPPDRVARPGLRARGRARGAEPDPRAQPPAIPAAAGRSTAST